MRAKYIFPALLLIVSASALSLKGQEFRRFVDSSQTEFQIGKSINLCFSNSGKPGLTGCEFAKKISNDIMVSRKESEKIRCKGNYYSTYVENYDVFLQKYDSHLQPAGNPVKVNDTTINAGQNGISGIASLPNGRIFVWFIPLGYSPLGYADRNVYGRYFSDTVKLGDTFVINEKPNYDDHIAWALPDSAKNIFHVFIGERDVQNYDTTRIVVFTCDENGAGAAPKFTLNKDSHALLERLGKVVADKQGNFYVFGQYITCRILNCSDAFVRKYDRNFNPLTGFVFLNKPGDMKPQTLTTGSISGISLGGRLADGTGAGYRPEQNRPAIYFK